MIEYFLRWIETLPEGWAFAAVIIILLICGLGAPFPEEIPLFLAGYLVYSGDIHLKTAIFFTLIAILVGDSMLFFIGYKFGNQIFKMPLFKKLLTPERVDRVNQYFHKYGSRVIFIARFMAGVRGPVFLTAGILQMPFQRFILFDGLGAFISAPTIVWVAYWFCQHFEGEIIEATKMVRQTEKLIVLLVVVLVIGISFLAIRIKKRKKTLRKDTDTSM